MQEKEILQLLQKRDETALRAITQQYGALCRKIALCILGNQQDAEECFNDALLAAWNAIPPEEPKKLSAYLAAVTRNFALNRYAAANALRRGGGQLPAVLDELAECVPAKENTEAVLDQIALREALKKFVQSLSDQNAKIFMRRYFSALPVAEIAAELGLREGSVKSSLKRMRDKLRIFLEKEELL